jgi:hypothetical protein
MDSSPQIWGLSNLAHASGVPTKKALARPPWTLSNCGGVSPAPQSTLRELQNSGQRLAN